MDDFTCSICGETFKGCGNNPWPVTEGEDDRCCDVCNEVYVIPARLKNYLERNKNNES